jgi:nitrate reductase gamma subunit
MILTDVIIPLTIQNIPQLEFTLETLKNVFFILVRFTKLVRPFSVSCEYNKKEMIMLNDMKTY